MSFRTNVDAIFIFSISLLFFSFFPSPDPEESVIIETQEKWNFAAGHDDIHENPRIVPAFLLNISIGGLPWEGEREEKTPGTSSSAQEIILWNGRG